MALLPDNKNPQPAQATQSASPQPKRKGTGFTNLQRILQASQGSKLGQTIAGGITGQAQQVQSGIQSAQEQFKTEARKKADELDASKRNLIIEQAVTDPSKLEQDAESKFKRYLSGEYTGPMELANRQQLAAQAQQAETVGRLASGIGSRQGTEPGGRQQLLSRFAGGADYTSGQRKLDESILARDKEANLAAAARQTRGVAEQAQRAGAIAQQEAQQYQNLAKIFAKETREKIGEAKIPISSEIDRKVTQAEDIEKQRNLFMDELNKQLKTNSILGLSPRQSADSLTKLLQQDQYKKYIPSEIINALTTSDNFINRAVALGKDPSNILLNSILAQNKMAENISRQGLVASDEGLLFSGEKLNALDKLLQKQEVDLEFSKNAPIYKAGQVVTNLNPFKKEVYVGEKEKTQKEKDSYAYQAGKARDNFMKLTGGIWSELVNKNPDGTVSSRSKDPLTRYYINEYNKQIQNINKTNNKIIELDSYLKQIQDEENAQAIGEL